MPKNDSLATIWKTPDDLWSLIAPFFPPPKPPGSPGRPRSDMRRVFDGILWVLRTGCQWKAVPPQIGAGSTLHDWHQEFQKSGLYARLWGVLLEHYEEEIGIAMQWQSVDGCMTKAPLGGEATGRNPTDRGKSGTKRSLLVDQRGAPLGVEIQGANVPDMMMLADTLGSILIEREEQRGEHLCLDKGYDTSDCDACCADFGYQNHTRRKGEPELMPEQKTHAPKRWVVERTHSWLNRYRRLKIRWEKKVENYYGLIAMAAIFIIYRITKLADPDSPVF